MAEVHVMRADSGHILRIREGDGLVVTLPEAPEAGLHWAIEAPADRVLRFHGQAAVDEHGAGARRDRVFRFHAWSEGVDKLVMRLRPETGQGDAERRSDRFVLTLHVG